MSRLYDALQSLRPLDFSEVPLDDLNVFLRDTFSEAEVIANSVPPPPGGNDFVTSSISRSDVNGASNASEITSSAVRPPPPDPSHVALQEMWGKPLKLSQKDNPLGISVYKMAGNDRYGAWFARRSVHEGLGFAKWKRAMETEFVETLKVQGRPGEGSIRGIGGDQRLEVHHVDGVGKIEVYQLSAQFPGPVAPREFVTLLMTSDNALSDASKPHLDSPRVPKLIPRHFMVVSRPVTHPAAPPRSGLVRGQYESVEMIREIPITRLRSSSATDLSSMSPESPSGRRRSTTIGFAESRGPSAKGERRDRSRNAPGVSRELNPVEWIMITRSDPGGGIPRFMVERGTPSSIVADAAKFLDWACRSDFSTSDDERDEQSDTERVAESDTVTEIKRQSLDRKRSGSGRRSSSFNRPLPPGEGGVVSALTHAVESGLASYTPNFVHDQFFGQRRRSLENESTETSSIDSFESAEQFKTAQEGLLDASSEELLQKSQHIPTEDDSELADIQHKKSELDSKLEKIREKEAEKMRQISEKDEKDAGKARERMEREIRKQEERHQKELAKLQQRRDKEARKLEEKRRKAAEKDALLKMQRERDAAKSQLELLKKENAILKEQVGQLQRENTTLVAKFGKSEEGQKALKLIRQDSMGLNRGRGRTASFRSEGSETSKKSIGSDAGSGIVHGIAAKSEEQTSNKSRDRLHELVDEAGDTSSQQSTPAEPSSQ